MAKRYVCIGPNQTRKAVEIGAKYEVTHRPASRNRNGEYRYSIESNFPGIKAVTFYGTLSRIERDILEFTDVKIPSQHRTGGSEYGINSIRYIDESFLERLREETIDISDIVKCK